jgi:heptosyltransferase-2
LLRRLHERHAGRALDVLAPPWTEPVFARMPEVRRTLNAPYSHGDLALIKRYRNAGELRAARYTQAIVLPNSFKSALIPWFAGIGLRTGYIGEARWAVLNDARWLDPHALPTMAERFAALAEDRGQQVKRPLAPPRLHVDDEQRMATLGVLGLSADRPAAVLCPGAEYGPAKRWPAEHFAQLASRLGAAGYAVWLVGSRKDEPVGDGIARGSGNRCVNLCGRTTLAQAIDVLACATLVISNDSGLMHVAAAFDKPLVAIYGSSSPAFTPPLSTRARIVKLDLPCSPCFERVCPLGHLNCMRQLSPAQVWQRIEFDKITSPSQ